MSEARLTATVLQRLVTSARDVGFVRLGAVRLDHPGFAVAGAALDRFLDRGHEGEMGFLSRTREVRKHPEQMLPGARTVLVAAVPYRGGEGSIARYARTVDYHTEIFRRLAVVAETLEVELPGTKSLICVDTKPLLERTAAALAGLGFIGKHGCVIVPGLGSYTLLGALLTTAVWEGEDVAMERAHWQACGSCRRCLDACPTDAFTGPGELDARRCISYLTIEHRGPIEDALADRLGGWIAGCDVCQEVCPYNASESRESRVPHAAWLPDVPGGPRPAEPATVATLGSGRYRAFVRDTALRRIPRRALRRNALLAIGNATGPLSEAERAAVEAAEADTDPQLVAAAARARRKRLE